MTKLLIFSENIFLKYSHANANLMRSIVVTNLNVSISISQ